MLGNIGLSSSSSVHVQVCWRTFRDFIAREGVRVFPGAGFVESPWVHDQGGGEFYKVLDAGDPPIVSIVVPFFG